MGSFSVSGVENIKKALYEHGPLSAAFSVYSDFPTYKSGVYEHKTGSMLGGHAVLIVGYGTENGVDYWRVKNSWNDQWGDNGFFKIKQGDCGIDDQVNGVLF